VKCTPSSHRPIFKFLGPSRRQDFQPRPPSLVSNTGEVTYPLVASIRLQVSRRQDFWLHPRFLVLHWRSTSTIEISPGTFVTEILGPVRDRVVVVVPRSQSAFQLLSMPSKRERQEIARRTKRIGEKQVELRTLIAVIAGMREILHLDAEVNGSQRPSLREPSLPLTSISQQSDATKDLLVMLQSWSTLQIRRREIMAVASTLSEGELAQLKRQMVGTSLGPIAETFLQEMITLYVTGNPRKQKGICSGNALPHVGKEPSFITIPESDVTIDLANPVPFLVKNW
jgi:hypothetical protein